MINAEALARFMSRLAAAAQEFAETLQPETPPTISDAGDEAPAGLGARQEQAYRVLTGAPEDGLPTALIAKAMDDYDVPNAYLTLRRLEALGLAELVPGSKPQRWRLHPKLRGSAGPYLLAAQHIQRGEWTTYGDVAVAVRGDDRGARAVGRAVATLPSFPNPHRILRAGGTISPEMRFLDGSGGAEECQRRLEEEGISFADGHADPARRLGWEELRERLRVAGVDVPPAAA